MDSSQKLTAYAYVWANIDDPNLYGDWHFEVMAIDMSYRLGWIDESIMKRASNILKQAKLPTAPPDTMTVEMFKSRC